MRRLISLNDCFSGLIALGSDWPEMNMVHRTSAAPNALNQAKALNRAKALIMAKAAHHGKVRTRWQVPLAAGPGAGEKKWKMDDAGRGTIRAMDAVAAHPLAELLECPPEAGNLLNGAAQCIDFEAGEVVFRQHGICKGLYVVVSGLFLRKAERLQTRLTLGPARAGDLVELAAALGDGHHTYTLCAQTQGSLLLLAHRVPESGV
jgi:hypothetical protein